jgi:uncharacterized glyoxalase superfamily protein PhnB
MASKKKNSKPPRRNASRKPPKAAARETGSPRKTAAPRKAAAPRQAAAPRKAAAPAPTAASRYGTLTPVLSLDGAERAIAFYKAAFGAEERARMPGPDGKIMHAELVIGGSVLMLSDALQQPASRSSFYLYVDDCDALYGRAVAAGATPTMPLADQFWGDRFGQVTDPFGNVWAIATHKEDVSPEEVQRRMAASPPPSAPPGA